MTESPFELSDALVDALAALRPISATMWGVSGHDHQWDDLSPEGWARAEVTLRAWLERVNDLPLQNDRWGHLAVHVMRDQLMLDLVAIEHGDHFVDLNNIASSFQSVRMAFDSMDTSTDESWGNVASRLETVGVVLDGYRRTLEQGLSTEHRVAARQVRAVIAQGRVHSSDLSFFYSLAESAKPTASPATVARLVAAAPVAARAYATLTDWLEAVYLPRAKAEDGVGRQRYLREMRRFLGSTPNPEETYLWGFAEMRRIHTEMCALADAIAPGKPLADVLTLLRTDPACCAPDRASFLEAMRAIQTQALADLDGTHFDVPEEIRRVEVKLAPPGGNLGAYYVPPSEDFTRPGTVWYSLDGDGPFGLYDEVSTAYHEGFPGHHLQCGLQVALTKNLSRLHRVAYCYSGFAEGWALYAEQLMRELGYYAKPEYELGMLANQMMRACRVAFDIGAHLDLAIPDDAIFHPGERWTYELGVEMMETLGGMARANAESEITRYLGWPGQAISYKVGQREMLALRDEYLREHPGELKTFHSKVLACGNVGLELLRGQVMD